VRVCSDGIKKPTENTLVSSKVKKKVNAMIVGRIAQKHLIGGTRAETPPING